MICCTYFFILHTNLLPYFIRPDVEKLLLSVGFGFFLNLTPKEALAFIDKKVDLLNQRNKALENEAIQINADIKLVLSSLSKLQGLSEEIENI